MNPGIEIVTREPEHTLEIRASAPMWKMAAVIGTACRRIVAYLETNNSAPKSAPYIRYLDVDWDGLDRENLFAALVRGMTRQWQMLIGFPVSGPTPGKDDILAGTLAAGRYVQALHRGPYRKVGATYKAMLALACREKIAVKNESIEIYLNDPRTVAQKDLETLVLIPAAE